MSSSRHAPDALAAAVVDDDGGGPEPDAAQVGAGVLAAAGARGGFRQRLDEVDAAERVQSAAAARRCRGARWCRAAPASWPRSLSGVSAGRRELERRACRLRCSTASRRGEMRSTLSGARRPRSSALRLSESEADGAMSQRHAARIGDADVLQLERRPCRPSPRRADDIFDGTREAGELLGERLLDVAGEEGRARSGRAADARTAGRPPAGTRGAGDAGDLGVRLSAAMSARAAGSPTCARGARLGAVRARRRSHRLAEWPAGSSRRVAPRSVVKPRLPRSHGDPVVAAPGAAGDPPCSACPSTPTRIAPTAVGIAASTAECSQLNSRRTGRRRKKGAKSDQRKACLAAPPRRHAVRRLTGLRLRLEAAGAGLGPRRTQLAGGRNRGPGRAFRSPRRRCCARSSRRA